MDPLHIALIGCGTVGSGVAKLLLERPERLAARAGRQLVLKHVVVKDPRKPRPEYVPSGLITTPTCRESQTYLQRRAIIPIG